MLLFVCCYYLECLSDVTNTIAGSKEKQTITLPSSSLCQESIVHFQSDFVGTSTDCQLVYTRREEVLKIICIDNLIYLQSITESTSQPVTRLLLNDFLTRS